MTAPALAAVASAVVWAPLSWSVATLPTGVVEVVVVVMATKF